jgi:hypothetical protein
MAKQTIHRHRIGRVAATLVVSLVVAGCAAASTAPPSALPVPAFGVAPIEGSPEQTAIEIDGAAAREGSVPDR